MYARPAFDESGVVQVTRTAVRKRREVWLRGNVRPGVAVGLVSTISGVGVIAAAAAFGLSSWLVGGLAVVVILALVNAGVAVWSASQPRLARADDALEVRLAPWQIERVPLEVVECIFRGSDPIVRPGGEAESPQFRVGTVVVRLAERAKAWHRRPTFRQWGTWDDGHLVIDGRWCEPLTRDTVQGIATRLLEAKREVAAETSR